MPAILNYGGLESGEGQANVHTIVGAPNRAMMTIC